MSPLEKNERNAQLEMKMLQKTRGLQMEIAKKWDGTKDTFQIYITSH